MGSLLSGTYRCMGHTGANGAASSFSRTLFIRIS